MGHTRVGPVNVIKGPAALKVGKYWRGIASGNVFSNKRRRTVERALEDAKKLEQELEREE